MAVQLAGITLPGPDDVLGTARLVAGWGAQTVSAIGALPDRVGVLLDQVDKLIDRMEDLAQRADTLIVRVDSIAASAEEIVQGVRGVTDGAAGVVERAGQITNGADAVVAQAEATSRGATELLATYRPLAERAAPLARRFVDELSEQEVHAAIKLVDELPRLAEHMESDIMPILATLDRVGPDIHELLAVVKDLRLAINGIPGLAYFRRRGTVEPE